MSIQEENHAYPYLDDARSQDWIRNNRTMFVMRGLPGSGKSFLVKKIVQGFGAEKVSVCSADDYFVTSQGTYEWDHSRLKDAHEDCQERVRSAACSGIRVVVVDNTHVQYWEMIPYFQMAKDNGYRVIIAEPKTSWRLNPQVLAERNSHNVPQTILEKKVRICQKFLHVRPSYFGWFLSAKDSRQVLDASSRVLSELTKSCEVFNEEFSCDPLTMFNRDALTDKDTLHCTAKFFKREKKTSQVPNRDLERYLEKAYQSVGSVTSLTISGFVVTGRTLGARVELCEEQLEVYDQDDFELVRHLGVNGSAKPNGSRAHITLGTKCKEVRAAETGLDTLRALNGTSSQIAELAVGDLWKNPDGVFHLKLKEVINCDAMFTGYY